MECQLTPKIPSSARFLFRQVALLSERRGEPAYAVGGFVRDLVLGVPSFDLDFAVEGDALAFARDLAGAVGGAFEAFTRFGTAIVTVPAFGKVDLATTRSESYARPAALPDVKPASLLEDLRRRDFTLNSIALRLLPSGKTEWVDPTGGLEDLARGILRAHHAGTFEDDPTRILRGVRFEQRFGFRIEKQTLGWLKAAVRGGFLAKVSGERVRNELRLVFAEPQPGKAVRRLSTLGVWARLYAGLKPPATLARIAPAIRRVEGLTGPLPEPWMVWLAALAPGLRGKERNLLTERFLLSGIENKILLQTEGFPGSVRKLFGKAPPSQIHGALQSTRSEALALLDSQLPAAQAKRLAAYLALRNKVSSLLNGKDLIDQGFRPGPGFSGILARSYGLQLDGKVANRSQALKWLETQKP